MDGGGEEGTLARPLAKKATGPICAFCVAGDAPCAPTSMNRGLEALEGSQGLGNAGAVLSLILGNLGPPKLGEY